MAPRRQDLAVHFDSWSPQFEFAWTQVVEFRMHSVAIVKPLDVIDDTAGRMLMRLELFVVDLFYFEASIKLSIGALS